MLAHPSFVYECSVHEVRAAASPWLAAVVRRSINPVCLVEGKRGALYASASAVMGIAMEALTSVPTATPHLTCNGPMRVTKRWFVQEGRTGPDLVHEVPSLQLPGMLLEGECCLRELVALFFELFQTLAAVEDHLDIFFHDGADLRRKLRCERRGSVHLFDLIVDVVHNGPRVCCRDFALEQFAEVGGSVGR